MGGGRGPACEPAGVSRGLARGADARGVQPRSGRHPLDPVDDSHGHLSADRITTEHVYSRRHAGCHVGFAPARRTVPPGFAAASVTFVSDAEGFVLGTAPRASPPCTSVLRTMDGRATGMGIPAPGAPLAEPGLTPGTVSALRFADPLDGFAFGPGLWTTHEGGAHWNQPGSVAGIAPCVVSDLVAASSGVYALVSPWRASTNWWPAGGLWTPS